MGDHLQEELSIKVLVLLIPTGSPACPHILGGFLGLTGGQEKLLAVYRELHSLQFVFSPTLPV